jgi:hypothetical protein
MELPLSEVIFLKRHEGWIWMAFATSRPALVKEGSHDAEAGKFLLATYKAD